MKRILLLFFLFAGCQSQADRYESFGTAISAAQAEPLTTLAGELKSSDSVQVKVKATIDEVCQMKGCWMTLKTEDGSTVRVTFKDYGFFVPKDAGGREVILEGVATAKEMDEATARHYAEDAGKPFDETANLTEIAVVASGVLIKKADQL